MRGASAIPRFLTQNKNTWLITCFLAYLLLLSLFAFEYHQLYLENPSNFAFNTEILLSQRDSLKATTEREIKNLTICVQSLGELADGRDLRLTELETETGVGGSDDEWVDVTSYPSGLVFEFANSRLVFREPTTVHIFDKTRAHLATCDMQTMLELPLGTEQYKKEARKFQAELSARIQEDNKRLAHLPESSTRVWTYWDFFYFSTMTQGTVGYGDILPNSTTVRMLAVLQVLTGYLILVVVINLAVRRARDD